MKRKTSLPEILYDRNPFPQRQTQEGAFAHGISRRVVVVDAADSQLFEQIIYIVRDNASGSSVTAADIIAAGARSCRQCAGGARTAAKQRSYTGLLIGLCSVAAAPDGNHRIPVTAGDGRFSTRKDAALRGVFATNSGCQRESVRIKRLNRF